MKKTALIISLTVLFLAGCVQTAAQSGTGTTSEVPNTTQTETPAELTDEQKTELEMGKTKHTAAHLTFHVTGGSYYFTPSEITIQKGDYVKIVFENAGGMHNFMLDKFNVAIDTIKTGETATGEFRADQSGTFEYYCGVGSHSKMGQTGKLIVE